ncbi:CehA/McbA family metallohydrolase [Horticoccus sp. 23ND18S-11]|uniref:CehA/McbA family metallohydrolase n=1 Tax=Horticoccus sp. 23ND18S-11 TaxID=3391832 RepID=UPI0039C9D4F3
MKTPLRLLVVAACLCAATLPAATVSVPVIENVAWQPLTAQVKRVIEALESQGAPLPDADRRALAALPAGEPASVAALQQILDRHCLFFVNINPEMRVKVTAGPAAPELNEQGWRQFLVKVHNEAGTTAALHATSPNAQRLFNSPAGDVPNRWLELQMFDAQPLRSALSGLEVEYRIIQLHSRDAGRREAKFSFDVGQGTQDIGFRNEVDLLFRCLPAREIMLGVRDENNRPTTAAFVIRDALQRVYPSQAKRLAPDFAFHPQIYRADGETLKLPAGTYTVAFQRGPESVPLQRTLTVDAQTSRWDFKVERWIDPAKLGWISGDHHIHAAGCSHYTNPTEGVHAPDMMRHCLGEDLKVGANLTWGPCFDYQKQFFTGKEDAVSTFPYILRYDIEVSGFGSHQSGHLCLLRLKDQMYPGGDSSTHWPTLGLNTLRWAKKQGAVVGPAHSGWGLQPVAPGSNANANSKNSGEINLAANTLPNYIVPPFNGIGANEYIVDVTHLVPGPDGQLVPAVDFISTVDTPYLWELNIWYHTLNVGFRTRISGETDFPCIYGERVGLGRSYVKLPEKWTYEDWCDGIRAGRNYVGDGKSHLLEFQAASSATTIRMGEADSELRLALPGKIRASARVAAYLNSTPDPEMKQRRPNQKPYWDVERARVGDSREVAVELIVNGYPVAKKNIPADGRIQDVAFDAAIERSSWVALRILPSSHTNPIFVVVGDKPIRASRRSAEWCLKGVDQCWSQKERFIKPAELQDARDAYAHARTVYRQRIAESTVE